MFNKLIDLLITFIGLFQCWTYVPPYERGVILRRGLLNRVIGPGWQWLWPVGFAHMGSRKVGWLDWTRLRRGPSWPKKVAVP